MSGTRPAHGEDDAAGRLAAAELFFQHSRDLFALFGPNGEVLRLNPAWEAVTGWTLAELTGSSFPALIHPEDFPALVKGLRNAFEGKSGRVKVRWSKVSLHDLTEQARGRAWEQQARGREIANAAAMWQLGFWDQTDWSADGGLDRVYVMYKAN